MGDSPIPYSPSPPSTPMTKSNNMPLLYYGLVVVGTAAIVLVAYNLIILRWCSYSRPGQSQRERMAPSMRRLEAGVVSSQSFDNPNAHLISSFKYKKEGSSSSSREIIGAYNEYECAVCLSVFEEDEELRQLPRCKHSFHAPCIDMWLYSHLDCPLCRSPVDPPPFLNRVVTTPTRLQSENSRPSRLGLLASVSV